MIRRVVLAVGAAVFFGGLATFGWIHFELQVQGPTAAEAWIRGDRTLPVRTIAIMAVVACSLGGALVASAARLKPSRPETSGPLDR